MSSSKDLWDDRFSADHYVYGTEPNTFLVAATADLPRGRTLSLAEGEGRNAVWLASAGFEVWAVDQSAVGVEKTRRLADERGVTVTTEVADLGDFEIEEDSWDLIVSIFAHTDPATRQRLHRAVVEGLRPGGAFVLEAYTPAQLGFVTGGPKDPSMMLDAPTLTRELHGLKMTQLREVERDVVEGTLHTGRAAVVQLVAHKPMRDDSSQ